MEQSQLGTIDTICQNIQLMASVLQEHVSKKEKIILCFQLIRTVSVRDVTLYGRNNNLYIRFLF